MWRDERKAEQMADAAMQYLGELDGKKCYWAAPKLFEKPGFYYWDGVTNVHVPLDLKERAASLHEVVNPASDDERANGVPGSGAMGAVIEYRDAIRKL